jgi:solute:Na+ symporter, SSS family
MAQAITLILGIFAVIIAAQFRTVLDSILYAYSFLVSGLFIPTLGAFFWKRASATGALIAMVCGGGITMLLIMLKTAGLLSLPFGLDPVVFGMAVSALSFVAGSYIFPQKK